MGRRSSRILALAVAALALLASEGSAAAQPSFGVGIAVLVRLPGADDVEVGAVSGPPRELAVLQTYAYPADGSVVSIRAAATGVQRGAGANANAHASATILEASLFGGEVEVQGLAVLAYAVATRQGASGDLSRSSLDQLSVGGEPAAIAPNTRVDLGEWGYAVVLEQAVLPNDAAGDGFRGFVTGLHVYLKAAHGGLPAGAEILVGYAEAVATAAAPSPLPPAPGPGGATGPAEPPESGSAPFGPTSRPPRIVRDPPPGVLPDITGRGYTFPVYGSASFSNDFGAIRLTTGWHHGNDIFAPLGTPVLAAASGTVSSVGWSTIGGWRLWLRDAQGNGYYYAHLSAYSPLALEGARVRAGDVLGFVGDSGDARGTPHHLHFEIHPAALLGLGYDGVVNPYEYLLAWRERDDASVAAAALAGGRALRPGAVLLDVEDISTASGLDPGAALRALGLLGEETALFGLPAPASVIGASPGFR